MENKYDKKVIIDFLKDLQKAKVVKSGSHKNEKVVNMVMVIANLTPDEFEKDYKDNSTVAMFYGEFTDWIETYNKVA